jgi:hypothetical protein
MMLIMTPQIYMNMMKGSMDIPRFRYAVANTSYALILPLIVDFSDPNMLYKRPYPTLGAMTLFFVIL